MFIIDEGTKPEADILLNAIGMAALGFKLVSLEQENLLSNDQLAKRAVQVDEKATLIMASVHLVDSNGASEVLSLVDSNDAQPSIEPSCSG